MESSLGSQSAMANELCCSFAKGPHSAEQHYYQISGAEEFALLNSLRSQYLVFNYFSLSYLLLHNQ